MSGQNEMPPKDSPIDVFMINDLETLNVVADPLRVRILDLLRGEPQTVKQLNEILRIGVSKLYYHMRLLEQHHLIHVYETRVVNGILEKHYQATAYKLSVDHALFSSSPATSSSTTGLDVFLSAVLDETRKDIQHSVREGLIELTNVAPLERQLYLGRCWARLSPTQAQQFRARLDALADEFLSLAPDPESQDLQWYEWLIGLYPTHSEPGAPKQGLDTRRQTASQDAPDRAIES
ncbi:MAG: helix-turn-helix domain-containing protein [Ktedonobacterales bacterium]